MHRWCAEGRVGCEAGVELEIGFSLTPNIISVCFQKLPSSCHLFEAKLYIFLSLCCSPPYESRTFAPGDLRYCFALPSSSTLVIVSWSVLCFHSLT